MIINKIHSEVEGEGESGTELRSEMIATLPLVDPATYLNGVNDDGDAAEHGTLDQIALASPLAGSPSSELPYDTQLWGNDQNWSEKDLEDILAELGTDINNALEP